MSNDLNPFRPTRWEHDSSGLPLIWFSPTALSLAGDKSVFVHGSRGSGKTTLLKSICWEELLNNESLRLQKKLGDLSHVGIYIRLPDHVAISMGAANWEQMFPDAADPRLEHFRFFSLALELICVDKSLTAVHALRVAGELEISALAEGTFVEEFLLEYEKLAGFGERRPRTFVELSLTLRSVVRSMNEATGRGKVRMLIDFLPAREPGQLLEGVSERLSSIVRLNGLRKRAPGFKFCLDDCEVLNEEQRLSVNTLVRKSKFPVSWVICSVGEVLEGGATYLVSQPLTDADRKVISLDDRDRREFNQLCEAVASLRTYFSVPPSARPHVTSDSISKQFSLENRLGNTTVNDLIHAMLHRSTSPLAKQITEAATSLTGVLKSSKWKIAPRYLNDDLPPYYEAYLLWHWTGRADSFDKAASEQDLQRITQHASQLRNSNFQAWLRRKMVGALLHISARLSFRRIPLFGAGVVTSLADRSIRDFLEIMAEIYDEYARARGEKGTPTEVLEKFARSGSRIAAGIQTAGIYAASEAFFEGIGSQDAGAISIARIVEALGKLTGQLQTTADDPTSLSTTERGVFVLEDAALLWAAPPPAIAFLDQIMVRGALSGYFRNVTLRIRPSSRTQGLAAPVGLRLHRRFAPKFRFSYRGAYEPISLSKDYLATLCDPVAVPSVDDWVDDLSKRLIASPEEQLSLDLEEVTDDRE